MPSVVRIKTMKTQFCFALISVVFAGVFAPITFASPPEKPIRVLIVDGFSNHDWRLTTHYIRAILDRAGHFAVDVSTAPPTSAAPGWDQWHPAFEDYHVVIQNCNDINGWPSLPMSVRTAHESYMQRVHVQYNRQTSKKAYAD